MAPRFPAKLVVRVMKAAGATALVGSAVELAFNLVLPVQRWRLRKIPGTKHKPLVGDGLDILEKDLTPWVDAQCAKYSDSPVFKFYLATVPVVVVRDPRLGAEMLKSVDTRVVYNPVPWAPKYEREPWCNILLFVNGAKWAKGRKATEESVAHAAALNAHVDGMQVYISRLLHVLDQQSTSRKPVNVQACCITMSEDSITQAVMGVHMRELVTRGAPEDVGDVLVSAAGALNSGQKAVDSSLLRAEQIEDGWWDKYPLDSPEFGKRFVSSAMVISSTVMNSAPLVQYLCLGLPRLTPLWRLLARVPTKKVRLQRKMLHGVQQATLKLVSSWKAGNLVDGAGNQGSSANRDLGLMPHILSQAAKEGGEQFDEHELLGAVLGALFGGFETTGATLSMCLYYLSRYPEVQRKAQQEVDQVLGGKIPDPKQLKDLPYLTAILNEVLRLASPAPFTGRYIAADYEHPSGFKIPAGFSAWFPLATYHTDPSIWPRPLEFLPDRFMPGHEDLAPADPELYYVPFGGGSRRCVGYRFAVLQARLALARMLQRFEFRPAEGCPEPVLRTNLVRMADKVMLKVARRADTMPPA